MQESVSSVLEKIAKIYNQDLNYRATDILRLRTIVEKTKDLPQPEIEQILSEYCYPQKLSGHSYMVAQLAKLIVAKFGSYFANAGIYIKREHTIVLALDHDIGEYKSGDTVPSIGFRGFTPESKLATEFEAVHELYDSDDTRSIEDFYEYEARTTHEAMLVKICDILELFCHNRILARFGLGIITKENYKTCAPETWAESEKLLSEREQNLTAAPLTIAELLEDVYVQRFHSFNFKPIFCELFFAFVDSIRDFPFELYLSTTP